MFASQKAYTEESVTVLGFSQEGEWLLVAR
jgi:hypothetical protein